MISPPLRRPLLLSIAVANAIAFAAVVGAVMLSEQLLTGAVRALVVLSVVGLVAVVWTRTIRRRVQTLVEAPLAEIVHATHAVAEGDTNRQVPLAGTRELDELGRAINQMTAQLLDAQRQQLRVEKLATTGRLAAGIAHEVGNPLAAIRTYSFLARGRRADGLHERDGRLRAADASPGVRSVEASPAALAPVDPHASMDPLDALDREVDRVDRIVRGLLDYARPRRVTPRSVSVDAVLRDVLGLLTDQGVTRQVQMDAQFDAPTAEVYAERHELEQVFVNLLLNATDAMDGRGRVVVRSRVVAVSEFDGTEEHRASDAPGERFPRTAGKRARAWLARADRPTSVVQVLIADSGPGVDAADAEQIFEPFYTTKAPGRGTGLGLAIVSRLVENAGGTVWVQPAREGGAAFVVLLPLLGAGM